MRAGMTVSMDISPKWPSITVAGLAGGAAEVIACNLLDSGASVAAILDRAPYSPKLIAAGRAQTGTVYYGESTEELVDLASQQDFRGGVSSLLENKVLIAVDDNGDETLRMLSPEDARKDEFPGERFIRKLASELPTSLQAVISSSGAKFNKEARRGLGGMLGPKGNEAFRSWCQQNNKPYVGLQYGKLTGGVPGVKPLPFKSMPLQEPELHPSYVLRSVVCTSVANNKYATDEMCTRDALADVIVQTIARSATTGSSSMAGSSGFVLSGEEDTLVLSIAGAAMTQNAWDKMFKRMQTSGNVELLKIEFAEILKPDALLSWISDSWFPQALIDADAATILTGARPVRAFKLGDSSTTVRIAWEDIQPDLSVKPAGALDVVVVQDASPPYISVRRAGGSGSGSASEQGKALPGEAQLMDRLIEAVNKDVFKKKFCVVLN